MHSKSESDVLFVDLSCIPSRLDLFIILDTCIYMNVVRMPLWILLLMNYDEQIIKPTTKKIPKHQAKANTEQRKFHSGLTNSVRRNK